MRHVCNQSGLIQIASVANLDFAPPSMTLASIRPTLARHLVITTRPNAASMLGQRRRRWANNKAALSQRLVFVGHGIP